MTPGPKHQRHEIFVDGEVHHFLHKTAKSIGCSENEVLRSMIFGEKIGMSADVREQAARLEEEHAQKRLTDDDVIGLPPMLGGTGRTIDDS